MTVPTDLSHHNRIHALDGLRALAILSVALFHYYARWAPADGGRFFYAEQAPEGFYPYGSQFADLFQYGYYGVQLFFTISGFVILMTLLRCRNLYEFAVRRFARLWPAMLLCVTISFLILSIWPIFFPQQILNFLPSLSFLPPEIFNAALGHDDIVWIDGAYWSLFVEVQFYVFISILYFISGRHFFYAICAVGLCFPVLAAFLGDYRDLFAKAFFIDFMPWFVFGMGCFFRHQNERKRGDMLMIIAALTLFLNSFFNPVFSSPFAGAVIFALMFAVLNVVELNKIFSWKPLTVVGMASYSFYLLHQNVGVTLIHVISDALHLSTGVAALIPLFVIAMLTGVSLVIFKYWENPANKKLVRLLGAQR